MDGQFRLYGRLLMRQVSLLVTSDLVSSTSRSQAVLKKGFDSFVTFQTVGGMPAKSTNLLLRDRIDTPSSSSRPHTSPLRRKLKDIVYRIPDCSSHNPY